MLQNVTVELIPYIVRYCLSILFNLTEVHYVTVAERLKEMQRGVCRP